MNVWKFIQRICLIASVGLVVGIVLRLYLPKIEEQKRLRAQAETLRQDIQREAEQLRQLKRKQEKLQEDPTFVEKIALEDEYFIEKKLYPNVDFYSGIVQKAIGIPTSMFTCIFALARTVGWMVQWEEMIADPEYKIGRPRQLYTGAPARDVPPIHQRAD